MPTMPCLDKSPKGDISRYVIPFLYFKEEAIIQGLFLGAESICHERPSREYKLGLGSTYSSYLHFPHQRLPNE